MLRITLRRVTAQLAFPVPFAETCGERAVQWLQGTQFEYLAQLRKLLTLGDRQLPDEQRLGSQDPVQHARGTAGEPFLRGVRGQSFRVDRAHPSIRDPQQHALQQLLLGRVVAEQRRLGPAKSLDDAVGAGGLEPHGHELALRGIEDPAPHHIRVSADRRLARSALRAKRTTRFLYGSGHG